MEATISFSWIFSVPHRTITEIKVLFIMVINASVVEGLESMTSNPVTSESLAWVRSPGDALVV
jgi:hypothetical protein